MVGTVDGSMERQAREALCDVGRRVWTRGMVASNDGNLSFRLSEDRVLCTPTMTSKGFLKPEDLVVVDMEGREVAGSRRSTSEIKLHLYIYRERPDVHSVVHVHPPHATAFAVAHRALPRNVLQEVELFLGEVPTAPYATTGTWEFARSIAPWVHRHDAVLLRNHGAVTVGRDPYDAYYRMECIDQFCRILLLAAPLGMWGELPPQAVEEMVRLKERYGIPDARSRAWSAPRPVGDFVPHTGPLTDDPKLSAAPPRPRRGAVTPEQLEALLRAVIDGLLQRPGTGSPT